MVMWDVLGLIDGGKICLCRRHVTRLGFLHIGICAVALLVEAGRTSAIVWFLVAAVALADCSHVIIISHFG